MSKVLIIEDNAFTRRLIKDKFTDEGFTVVIAKDGEEGLSLAKSEHPDVILLDIIMPKMDGVTMLQMLREKERINTPVIILSSVEKQEHVDQALQHNVFRYLIKNNTDLNSLVDATNYALQGEHNL